MKKIVLSTIPLRKGLTKESLAVADSDEKTPAVYFAVNADIAAGLCAGDEVKPVLIETAGGDEYSKRNEELFMEELRALNTVGATIKSAVPVLSVLDESNTTFNALFKDLIHQLEEDAEIYVDITYGYRPLMVLIFSVLSFAEKFYNCTVHSIVYSQVEWKDGEIVLGSGKLVDLTSLYLLSSFTNTMECEDTAKAVHVIELLLKG